MIKLELISPGFLCNKFLLIFCHSTTGKNKNFGKCATRMYSWSRVEAAHHEFCASTYTTPTESTITTATTKTTEPAKITTSATTFSSPTSSTKINTSCPERLQPYLDISSGCREPFKDIQVAVIGNCRPIFAVVAFFTWKCKEECEMSHIANIKCPKPLNLAFDNKMSCTCIGEGSTGKECATRMYSWSQVEAAHHKFCPSADVITAESTSPTARTTEATTAGKTMSQINPISRSASTGTIMSTTVAVTPCPENLQPYLDISHGCREPYKHIGVIIVEKCRPIFGVVAFFTWKCKEECEFSHIERIMCPKPLNVRFDGKMSCTCIDQQTTEKCATRMYSWSQMEAAHHKFCSSNEITTPEPTATSSKTAEVTTSEMNHISTSASAEITSPSTITVTVCPEKIQPHLDISIGCRGPFKHNGIILFGDCRPIFAAVAFFTWKCKEECALSNIQIIVCPKRIDTRFDGKMSCTCIRKHETVNGVDGAMIGKCATAMYSWSQVEAAHHQFCLSADITTAESTSTTSKTAEVTIVGVTTSEFHPISTSASTERTSPSTVTTTPCPENMQPHLDISSGCRKPFKHIGNIFVGNCRPIYAAMAFFTWKCKEDCDLSHIENIMCPKPINARFDDKMSCTCIGESEPVNCADKPVTNNCTTKTYSWYQVEAAHHKFCPSAYLKTTPATAILTTATSTASKSTSGMTKMTVTGTTTPRTAAIETTATLKTAILTTATPTTAIKTTATLTTAESTSQMTKTTATATTAKRTTSKETTPTQATATEATAIETTAIETTAKQITATRVTATRVTATSMTTGSTSEMTETTATVTTAISTTATETTATSTTARATTATEITATPTAARETTVEQTTATETTATKTTATSMTAGSTSEMTETTATAATTATSTTATETTATPTTSRKTTVTETTATQTTATPTTAKSTTAESISEIIKTTATIKTEAKTTATKKAATVTTSARSLTWTTMWKEMTGSSISSTVSYCPRNGQPNLDNSSGCRKPFQDIGTKFVGICEPIFAAKAFFTWRCQKECTSLSSIESVECPKPLSGHFDGAISCTCMATAGNVRKCPSASHSWSEIEFAHRQFCSSASSTTTATAQSAGASRIASHEANASSAKPTAPFKMTTVTTGMPTEKTVIYKSTTRVTSAAEVTTPLTATASRQSARDTIVTTKKTVTRAARISLTTVKTAKSTQKKAVSISKTSAMKSTVASTKRKVAAEKDASTNTAATLMVIMIPEEIIVNTFPPRSEKVPPIVITD